MYLRVDKLQIELPKPPEADPASAGVVQELLGGKFGEMSTLVSVRKHKNQGTSFPLPYFRR
jgi:Mn-containing catalase